MWDVQEQIKRMLGMTVMKLQEITDQLEACGMSAQASELSRAISSDNITPKQKTMLMEAHRILTEELERQNAEKTAAIKRAERALKVAESLDSGHR